MFIHKRKNYTQIMNLSLSKKIWSGIISLGIICTILFIVLITLYTQYAKEKDQRRRQEKKKTMLNVLYAFLVFFVILIIVLFLNEYDFFGFFKTDLSAASREKEEFASLAEHLGLSEEKDWNRSPSQRKLWSPRSIHENIL